MLTLLTLAVTTIGSLISFAVILTQFIGAQTQTLEKFALLQLICLVLSLLLATCIYYRLGKKNPPDHAILKQVLVTMPGWLIFILLLLIITALLGDLSVLLVRLSGHEIMNLFHLPSICITIFCFVYALTYYDAVNSSKTG